MLNCQYRVVCCSVAVLCCLLPLAFAAEEELGPKLKAAKTAAQLETLLMRHPDSRAEIIPEIEKKLIAEAKAQKKRPYAIGAIRPQEARFTGDITVFTERAKEAEGGVHFDMMGGTRIAIFPNLAQTFPFTVRCDPPTVGQYVESFTYPDPTTDYHYLLEYQGDRFMPFISDSSGGVTVTLCQKPGQAISARPPLTYGSVRRFIGEHSLSGVTFIGEGDPSHRLTFALVEKLGFVYLRGKGRVISAQGKEVKLGYQAAGG